MYATAALLACLGTAADWRQLLARLWFVASGRDVYAGG
jgi:hypothetical protein